MKAEHFLSEFAEKLRQSYDLSDDDRKALCQDFERYALENKEIFERFVAEIPVHDYDFYFNMVDALSRNSEAWQRFLLNLLKRIFTAAESSQNPKPIFESLQAYSLLRKEKNDVFQAQLRQAFIEKTYSQNHRIRKMGTWILGDFVYPDSSDSLARLERLKLDSDWKVIYYAVVILNEIKEQPLHKGIPLYDILRSKFGNVYEF